MLHGNYARRNSYSRVRTYVFRRGCTPVAPFEVPFPGTFSLAEDFSSPEPDNDVEKCLDEGARTRPGVVGFCGWVAGGCTEFAAELAFVVASRRG